MKITDIKVNQLRAPEGRDGQAFVGHSGRLIVRVLTDEGVVGIAEGARNLSVFRAYVDDLIKPLIVGMNPVQPRQIWETLALGTGQLATRFPSQIVGAIDVACWDITGKVAGLPVYARACPKSPFSLGGFITRQFFDAVEDAESREACRKEQDPTECSV